MTRAEAGLSTEQSHRDDLQGPAIAFSELQSQHGFHHVTLQENALGSDVCCSVLISVSYSDGYVISAT